MKKEIYIQTQGLKTGNVSRVKPVAFVAINCDNIKITINGYDNTPAKSLPRTKSLVTIIDDKECLEMTPEQLLCAVRFFKRYSEMGSDVVAFRNIFHEVMPDRYANALKQRKQGLKF
jgi:hypothetical protein